MKELNKLMQAQFDKMCATGKLFKSSITGTQVWDAYLKAFTPEDDPIFRDPESSLHNCNLCNNFIRRYGNIVALDEDYNIMTIWDVDAPEEYVKSCHKIRLLIKYAPIQDVFFETFTELNSLPYESTNKIQPIYKLGVDKNVKRYTREEAEKFGRVKPDEIVSFNHFHLFLPTAFVDKSGSSVESLIAEYRDAKNVFQRAMQEIPLDTLKLVRDLINQESLLDGKTHLFKVDKMIILKAIYDTLHVDQRDAWCWIASYKNNIAKFRNELIGTLCVDLAEGKEINEACKTWNIRVDPVNYMRAVAPITKRQIEEAEKFVKENNYVESFDRRFANINDIKASEILHVNMGDGKIKTVSIFDGVKATSTRHKKSQFDGIEEVSIEKFMKDILPTCTSVQIFLTSQHEKNLVSLTTANNPDSKPIFKWSNNYSWTFTGNLAGKSQIKEAVKGAGGEVNGVLRGSMIWNELLNDNSDLDIWCRQPDGTRIGFNTGFRKDSGNTFTNMLGQLDLDNTMPGDKPGIENIYFLDLNKMKDGMYEFWVNQFADRGSRGFKFEIDLNGEIYQYTYNKRVSGNIPIAKVFLKNGVFTIQHQLPASEPINVTKEIYGLETNNFHKVNLVCLSPNHWDGNNVGNKHYFFMMEGCKSPNPIKSFHNENLLPELAQHRKVLEVLAATNMIDPTDNQLSGLGFNATVRDEVVVRLKGSFQRDIKIKF